MYAIKKGEYQSPIFIIEGQNSKELSSLTQNEGSKNVKDENLCANGSTQDLICNPLSVSSDDLLKDNDIASVAKSRLGLIAQLYEGEKDWLNLDQYLKEGYKHQEYIYFSNFNIPSRDFQQGFGFGESDYLKNRNGEKLIEWFAIQAKGNIILPENESDGFYHIVTISDDGINVKIDGKTFINNSKTHSPTIDCANSLIEFKSNQEKTFELTYFQGPRTRIALMTFIKKIEDSSKFKKSTICSSKKGPEMLMKEGYKVIGPAWFTLPDGF